MKKIDQEGHFVQRLFFLLKKGFWFPVLLLGVFAILVSRQIHGSSLGGYWAYFEGLNQPDPNLLFGSWRGIRSDEWRVSTPWIIAQSKVNFAEENPLLGDGQSLVLTDAPIFDWEAIFEPQNWAFFFLPLKYAFAFRWWFRALLLVLGAYLLFLEMSGEKSYLAAMAAFSILFMPVIQWWYSTSYVETAAYFLLLLYCFMQIVNYRSIGRLAIWTLLFCYISLCYASILYVPALIPGLICLAFMMLGVLLNKLTVKDAAATMPVLQQNQSFKQILRSPAIKLFVLAFALVIVIDAFTLAIFVADNRPLIDDVSHSAYPGQRQTVGGSLSPSRLLGGFFDLALLDDRADPTPLGENQSEASSFFALSFFLLPVLSFLTIKTAVKERQLDYFLIFSLAAYFLLLIWSFFDLPNLLRNTLLLNYSTPQRVLIILGVLNHILIFYYLTKIRMAPSLDFVIFVFIYSIAVFCAYLYWINALKAAAPTFLSNWSVGVWITFAIVVMLVLLLLQKKLAFWFVFLAFSWVSTFSVNPLYRGLSPILSSKLSEAVDKVNKTDQNHSLWVAYDNLLVANYLTANGVHVLNSTQYAPQNELWMKFDPLGQYTQVYNRYAHILVTSTPDIQNVEFLLNYPDQFTVMMNPCNPTLEEVGVSYYVFPSRVEFNCLRHIRTAKFKSTPIFIYQRVPPS